MKRAIFLSLMFEAIGLVETAICADTDYQVKAMARRYNQVEEQLDRSVHYTKREGSGSETKIEQAWFNGAGDLLKVATEQTTPSGREFTEYFPYDREGLNAMFVLT